MARPLQKPTITDCGSSRMKRSSRANPANTIRQPARITEGKSVSTPGPFSPTPAFGIKVPIIAAKAPVAPLTIPGRPPKIEQISPTIHAA
mmetsp:Transcript_10771/g.20510  ORF Transcript_10771/g.20510 Transcript_10771/m.20510 type:complete len:90 (-) Transcript_10771:52-321(-)